MKLRTFFRASLPCSLILLASVARAQQPGLDAVLHQLDTASASFKSAQANLRWDVYERVVKETTTQCGTIYFLRESTAIEMGAKIAPSATNACATGSANDDVRVIAYKNAALQMFEPKANHLTIIKAGPNQAQYESFLTLGFGGSGRDLAKAWTITDQGAETLDDGATKVATVKLDLVAKDPGTRNTFSHIVIWVDPVRGISLKQQFFTPSGDYRTTYFDHIRYNQKVDAGAFALKTNGQTQVDRR